MIRQQIYSCGICDHYHRADWDGDCREDAERMTIDDVFARFGEENVGWEEVAMPGVECSACEGMGCDQCDGAGL